MPLCARRRYFFSLFSLLFFLFACPPFDADLRLIFSLFIISFHFLSSLLLSLFDISSSLLFTLYYFIILFSPAIFPFSTLSLFSSSSLAPPPRRCFFFFSFFA
jgi:hypothetical protein